MPPRTVKRGAAAAGPKRRAAAAKAAAVAESKVEEQQPDIVVKEEDRPAVEEKTNLEADGVQLDLNRLDSPQIAAEDVNKVSLDEYGKDERLDLDDNDPEYEPEEYGGVDFDDKEVEQEDVQEVEEVPEDPVEEHVVEEEETDLVEEELVEELEGEEDDEVAGDELNRSHTVDTAEEEEHHEMVKERRKRKEFEVFVGGLDKDATEDDLRKVFSQVGDVIEVRLMRNPQTKKNKGFAFLRFATVEQAKRAVAELKNPVINGKQCGVKPSQDSDTLFLGNICKTWTKEDLKEKLKHYGVDNVEDLTLVEDSNNQGMNRGFSFLEFSSRSDAMDAFRRLQKRDVLLGVDRPAKVSFADSFIDPGDEVMAQVKTIFIDGLAASWDEDYVRGLLKKYGEIEKIELARSMPSARRKDYGFVTFNTHDAAVLCAKNINNAELGEGNNKTKVRARLSRPLQRGKGKHSSHGHFRSAHGAQRTAARSPWIRAAPRAPPRPIRGSHAPLASGKRAVGSRNKRPPVMSFPVRARPPAPPARPYDRRAPVPSYPKREYSRREEIPPPRSGRTAADYGSRTVPERRPSSYRDDYSSRSSGYPGIPRGTSRSSGRRAYADDTYDPRFERPPPSYRDGHARDYEPVSGSKRPYAALGDVPPRYADASGRHSRTRIDYELGPRASQYGDAYDDRLGRSNLGYGGLGGRGSMSSQDSYSLYGSRHGMGYGGSYGGNDTGGMYPSSFSSDYLPRGSDVGGSSYSSMYSSRGMGGSGGYMGAGGSGSYY